jgi:protein-S-isoprenylcysteine O-methyltransferase Ste14
MNKGMLARGMGMVALLTAVLLLIGGRVSYWQVWIFGFVNWILVVVLSFRLSDQADLIRARMKPGPATKDWDRVLMALFFPLAATVPVVATLDAGRFGWSPSLHPVIYILGYAIYVFSARLHLGAIATNEFYRSTVSIEPEKGHSVVDSGPYRFVRHPGYTGIIFMELGIAVALGSVWAIIPAGLVAVLLIVRTVLEDAALRTELPGYLDYAKTVRYKIIPGIW